MASPTHLKRERRSFPGLSHPNLSTSRLGCQIALLDNEAASLLQIVRQPGDQEFSFNFAILSYSIVSSHKLNIVNVMRSVSRLSSHCAASFEIERMLSLTHRFGEVAGMRKLNTNRFSGFP